MKRLVTVVKLISTIGPNIKRWIYSDGKFNSSRAAMLIVALLVVMVSLQLIGPENTQLAIKMLDEISDIFGYTE